MGRFHHQLDMLGGLRDLYTQEHRAYVRAMKERVFSQFNDMDGEAEHVAEETYQRLISRPGGDDAEDDLAGR